MCIGLTDQGGAAAEDARAREWALVRALAELRGAPAGPAYLAALAAAGSWVRFLAEADTQAYPLRLVRRASAHAPRSCTCSCALLPAPCASAHGAGSRGCQHVASLPVLPLSACEGDIGHRNRRQPKALHSMA